MSEPSSIADLWEGSVATHSQNRCLIHAGDDLFPERTLSFAQVDSAANQVAHWALAQGLRKGDTVALFMENRPEFVVTWLGLAKVGIITAWLNNTIMGQPLVHSVSISSAKLLVFGVELQDVVAHVHSDLVRAGIESVVMSGTAPFCRTLDGSLAVQPPTSPGTHQRSGIKTTDTMCYIYTSGTTGLPKAAVISHRKYMGTGAMGKALLKPADVLYGSGMPLYHSAAGMIGIGCMIASGCSFLIRRKFSASAWRSDLNEYGVTSCQYIGELARYILALPERPDDKDNKLRLCVGNGLRPEYWKDFQVSLFNTLSLCLPSTNIERLPDALRGGRCLRVLRFH